MVKPVMPQIGYRDRLVAQRAGGADFEMTIDFSCQRTRVAPVGAYARLPASTMLEVGQVPHAAALVDADATDANEVRLLAI